MSCRAPSNLGGLFMFLTFQNDKSATSIWWILLPCFTKETQCYPKSFKMVLNPSMGQVWKCVICYSYTFDSSQHVSYFWFVVCSYFHFVFKVFLICWNVNTYYFIYHFAIYLYIYSHFPYYGFNNLKILFTHSLLLDIMFHSFHFRG